MTLPVAAVGTPSLGQWAMPKAGGAEWSVGAVEGADPAQQAPAVADPSGGFGSMLGGAIDSLQQTQDVAAAQSQALATGQTQDVTSVVTAVQEASLSMQLASQVRNKAVEAYTEIFHTQV
jgi:flagellar hook-basal body complex protein FliE